MLEHDRRVRDKAHIPTRTVEGDYIYRGVLIVRDGDFYLAEDSHGTIKTFTSVDKAVRTIDKAIRKAKKVVSTTKVC